MRNLIEQIPQTTITTSPEPSPGSVLQLNAIHNILESQQGLPLKYKKSILSEVEKLCQISEQKL